MRAADPGRGTVRYVGEPIAAVVAETRAAAEDGAAAVGVDYEPLKPVPTPKRAVASGAAVLHAHLGDNLAGTFTVHVGDPDAAFAAADRVVTRPLLRAALHGHAARDARRGAPVGRRARAS